MLTGLWAVHKNFCVLPSALSSGCTKSLKVESSDLEAKLLTGEHILINNGVDLSFISVPQYKVFLKSDLASGYVTVGRICPDLPVEGVRKYTVGKRFGWPWR